MRGDAAPLRGDFVIYMQETGFGGEGDAAGLHLPILGEVKGVSLLPLRTPVDVSIRVAGLVATLQRASHFF